jgi:hypothetical protein
MPGFSRLLPSLATRSLTAAELGIRLGLSAREAKLVLERLRQEERVIEVDAGWRLTDATEREFGESLRGVTRDDDDVALRPGTFVADRRWAVRGAENPIEPRPRRRGRYGNA